MLPFLRSIVVQSLRLGVIARAALRGVTSTCGAFLMGKRLRKSIPPIRKLLLYFLKHSAEAVRKPVSGASRPNDQEEYHHDCKRHHRDRRYLLPGRAALYLLLYAVEPFKHFALALR